MGLTTLVVAGIGWVAAKTVDSVTEGAADRAYVAAVRAIRERLPALAARPEGDDLARGVRKAQLLALEGLIEDYRAERPLARLGGNSDLFSERALAFCRSAAAPSVLQSPVSGGALLALAPASTDMDGLASGAVAIEDAVLAELASALDGIPVPAAFVNHLRNGGGGKPRFMELFCVYFAEEVKKDDAFREVLHTGLLLQNAANLAALGDWLVQVEGRFGGSLARLETGVADLAAENRVGFAAMQDALDELRQVFAPQNGVPAQALWPILEKLGEIGVRDGNILERLSAKADEFLSLREQLDMLAESTPNARMALSEGSQLLDTGDLDGARQRFVDARAELDAAHARDKAALLAAEAGVDRLQVRYREAADRYEEAGRLVAPFDLGARFDYLCRRAATLQQHGDDFGDNAALVEAVSLWREAVELRPRSELPVEWATAQNNLGVALRTLGTHEMNSARLQQAFAAHCAALEELTRERVPLDWAWTKNCVGGALLALGWSTRDTGLLEEALAAYRASLEERTRERVPLEWALTQGNLGSALLSLGSIGGGTARIEEAVSAYQAALAERPRERVPLDWALTQNSLGFALWNLGEREGGTARLEEAVIAYHAALEEQTRERMPAYWAKTQHYLGRALRSLGEREGNATKLEEAVTAYRAALEERTRERVPLDWAALQQGLGNALHVLGALNGDAVRLEEAVAAYNAALGEQTRERDPLQWAVTQSQLGDAVWALGVRERGTAKLEEAVMVYRAALEEQIRERVPLHWALTLDKLGRALLTIGERENGTARLKEAIDCFRSSSKIFLAANGAYEARLALARLAWAHHLLEYRMTSAYDTWCRPP